MPLLSITGEVVEMIESVVQAWSAILWSHDFFEESMSQRISATFPATTPQIRNFP